MNARVNAQPTVEPGRAAQPAAAPPALLLDLLTGMWRARAVGVAADLGIADLLAAGPRSVAELARDTGSDADSLYRLLRALAQLGVFAELEHRRFANNAASSQLRPDAPGSLLGIARMLGDEWQRRVWSELSYSVRTGEPASTQVLGSPLWQYFNLDRAAGARFDEAMAAFSAATNEPVVGVMDLSGVRAVVDVAGGRGALLAAVLERHPQIEQGVLFDQSHVVASVSRSRSSRWRVEGGDVLERVPAGADAYLIKNVLHNWDDASCVRILSNCRRAMTSGGRLLVAEIVLEPNSTPPFAYLLDLNMLVTLSGRERTADELRALFAAAGLRLERITPTPSPFSVLDARPMP